MNTFTRNEQITLAILPRITALCSIVALVYAIQLISRAREKFRILCNRILLGMYLTDLVRCLTYVTGTAMIPVKTEGVFLPTGNEATCAAQAFVSQFGFAVPLYAVSFNFYFFIAIKYDFNHSRVRWTEKWCHIIPISISLLLSALLLVFRMHGVSGKCFISIYFYLTNHDM